MIFARSIDAFDPPSMLSLSSTNSKIKNFLHLLDMGGDVLANGHARMLFTILSAVSEAERERVRERVLDVK